MKRNVTHGSKWYRIQYILTLVITMIALAGIDFYTYGSSYSIARSDAIEIGQQTVSQEAEKLNNFLLRGLDVVQVTGLTIDYMLEVGRSSEEIERFLRLQSDAYAQQIDENFTGIYGVFNGDYLDGIGWVPDDDYVPQERPWYTTALTGGGEPTIVSPYLDAQTNTIMISVSQLLSDGESVVSLDIAMDEMQTFAQSINLNGNGYGFIIDNTGLNVANGDVTQKGKNYLTDPDMQGTELQALAERIIDANGTTFSTELEGDNCIVFSKVIRDNWYVVMIINTDDLFNKVQVALLRNILISLCIFAVVVYFCTTSYQNRLRAVHYAEQLKKYQLTLEERVQEQTHEIKLQSEQMIQMQDRVIEGMATVIESRDRNTGEHVRNTKNYVSMIVNYMYAHHLHPEEVDEDFVYKLTSASVLHDVGKIMISDTILNKPGRFTPEEFEIMKTHSSLGCEIVADVFKNNTDEQLVQISSDVAHYHHEKWDGSGYPEGLKGEEIPLSARIMAVADVFDALISKRVYKDKVPVDDAFTILQRDSGTHFDPEIVQIFISLRKEIEVYLNK